MKTRLSPILSDFIRVFLAFLPVLPVIRLLEYLQLAAIHQLPAGSWKYVFSGLVPDLFVLLAICLVSIIPYILLASLSRKAASWIFTGVVTTWFLFHFALVRYFANTLVPLDQVIFSYTLKEMFTITASSVEFSLLTFVPFLVVIIATIMGQFLFRKVAPGRALVNVVLLLTVISPFLLKLVNPSPGNYERELNYYLAVNKPLYLIQKCYKYTISGEREETPGSADAAMLDQFRLYHANHPEFSFIGPTYPLLHKEAASDVLSGYFNLPDSRPNLVFIIVESLSSAFSGPEPYLGSFTPFLDSLSQHSLSWENCFSASERTFYVLPALFGSLPYGGGKYLDRLTRASYHQSLIRYLNNNGYTTRFFYGGDPSFNQMDLFLKRNDIGFILTHWGGSYKPQEKNVGEFKWGYPDHELFRRSFEVKDSMKTGAFLDIYLTLSMHAPFIPPDEAYYQELCRNTAAGLNLSAEEKNGIKKYFNIYTSILYTDDALRKFFSEYSKRPEFANTIFFITGDHSLPELNIGWYSPWERFRVPFIIYSPLLKGGHHFKSVITHNDVTPSVLSMLRSNYELETSMLAHWIGVGLDTTIPFHTARSIVFIRNNKEMVDFVENDLCLTDGRLTRIRPDMKADAVEDEGMRAKLKSKLDNFILVTDYVGQQNCLIPISMMFGHELTGTGITVSEKVVYDGLPTTGEFITVIKLLKLEEEFKYVNCDISFRLQSNETDPQKIPMIAFEILGPKGNKLGWDGYPLFSSGEYQAGRWNKVNFRKNIDLSYISEVKSCSLKLYLWNRDKITLQCDSLAADIRGYN